MLQAIVRKGIVFGERIPAPVVSPGCILVKVVFSCISPGTELSGVRNSEKPLIKRAMEQPEKVKKVLNWVKTEGISSTLKKVTSELEVGTKTGYSLSGIVIGVGKGVQQFSVGDRVCCAGGGIASHAEFVDVPVNLAVKMPPELYYNYASTVALGAIALHGVRRADLKIGEFCAVVGMGILGLITLQILKGCGIRVAVIDIDQDRLKIAEKLNADICINPNEESPLDPIINWSDGYGVDAVIFTAATSSSEPLSKAFQVCKKKGQVVLVGTAGMEIQRKDIYAKELDLKISTSYGPGRYDPNYEEKGNDYPYSYVRWSENRNMAEYLRLLTIGIIRLDEIPVKTFPIEQVSQAFASLQTEKDKPLFVLLDYGSPEPAHLDADRGHDRRIFIVNSKTQDKRIKIGLVGTGNFARNVHIPNMDKLKDKFSIHAVMDQDGPKAITIANQNQANYATTEFNDLIRDEKIDLVFICTRHDSHAELTLRALEAGKHVFVEKPLAINSEELNKIKGFYESGEGYLPLLMVGFNRRFSPYAQEIKKHVDRRINPLFISYRMNAGFLPPEHWVHSSGGRIIGEACHIIDLMTFFTGSRIESLSTETIAPATAHFKPDDNRSICLKYADGSLGTIDYFACGSKDYPKEMVEIHFDQKTIKINDYKSIEGYGLKIKEIRSSVSNKGHLNELQELYNSLTGLSPNWPILFEDIIQTTEATFLITDR